MDSQHKFSNHAYGDSPVLNPLLDEESALHCPPSPPFMAVMIGQAAKLDRRLAIGPRGQRLGPAEPKKNQVGGGLNRHVQTVLGKKRRQLGAAQSWTSSSGPVPVLLTHLFGISAQSRGCHPSKRFVYRYPCSKWSDHYVLD